MSATSLLSAIIPVRNEEDLIGPTVRALADVLSANGINHEILVIDDGSTDGTAGVIARLSAELPVVRIFDREGPPGFGFAVRTGLAHYAGDAVIIIMGDDSDPPEDVVRFYRALQEETDCVFGSRFMRRARVVGYPAGKLVLNRLGNTLIRLLFLIQYNDITNGFKMYRREVIDAVQPLRAGHFELAAEMPLRAILRGYRYTVLPNSWIGRRAGVSKFRVYKAAARYLVVVGRCLVERLRYCRTVVSETDLLH